MKRKQFLALMLSGALTFSMAPALTYAEEAVVAAEEGFSAEAVEEIPEEVVEEVPEEVVEEEPQQENVVLEEFPEENTEEVPVEIPVENPETAPVEEPVAEATPQPTEEAAVTPEAEEDGSVKTEADLLKAIQEAPTGAEESQVIQIGADLVLTAPVVIAKDKNIILASAGQYKITRAAEFKGDMFQVDGGKLQLRLLPTLDGSDAGYTLTVDGTQVNGESSEGTIVNVMNSGMFAMEKGITLTGNTTTAEGGAIVNKAGTLVLTGGKIQNNKADKAGAIYSDAPIYLQGALYIFDNKKADDTDSNLVLEGEMASIIITERFEAESKVGVSVLDPVDGKMLISMVAPEMTMTDALSVITLETEGYLVDENGVLKVEEPEVTVTPEPTKAPEVTVTPEPTKAPKPTVTPTQTPVATPTLERVSAEWTSYNSIKLECVSDSDGWYYVGWRVTGQEPPQFDVSTPGVEIQANRKFTIYLSDLDENNPITVYVLVKDKNNQLSWKKSLDFSQSNRPVKPTVAPEHVPVVPNVTESVVHGLEQALEFYPNQFYDFTVVGAGTQNTKPGEGDVKWVPLYWSMSSNPSDSQKHSSWKIGAAAGISQAATYNMYIFYQKNVYQNGSWVPTDVIQSVAYQFKSAAIEMVSPTPGANGEDGTGGTYYGEDGYSEDGTTPQDQTGTTTDTGTATAKNANTSDETPVASMSVLALLSALTGGYLFSKKRKKITD